MVLKSIHSGCSTRCRLAEGISIRIVCYYVRELLAANESDPGALAATMLFEHVTASHWSKRTLSFASTYPRLRGNV